MKKVATILREYIHNPRKMVLLIGCILLVLFVGVSQSNMTLSFQMKSAQPENGNIIAYYQDNVTDGFSENSLNVQPVSLDKERATVEFKINTLKLNNIRLDFDGINEFEIEGLKVSIGGIQLASYDANALASTIFFENDMHNNLGDNILQLTSDGDDSYLILGLANKYVTIKYWFCIIPATLLMGLLLFICLELIQYLYNRDTRKFGKGMKAIFLLFLIYILIKTDIQMISWVREKKTDEYMVQTSGSSSLTFFNEELRVPFTDHGKQLHFLTLYVMDGNEYNGSISYKIEGQEDVEREIVCDIDEILKEQKLSFDISTYHLQRGKEYILSVSFHLDQEIPICVNSDGTIRLKQVFDFAYTPLLVFIIVAVNVITLLSIYLILRYGIRQSYFVGLAIAIGFVLAFVVTPCSMDDEYRHFLRAYEIANGNILMESVDVLTPDTTGVPPVLADGRFAVAEVPYGIDQIKYLDQTSNYPEQTYFAEVSGRLSLNEMFYQLIDLDNKETKSVSMAATVGLSPLSYWPQVIPIFLGQLLGAKPLALFYLARFGNIIVCTLLAYASAKLLPQYQMVIWSLFFIPRATVLRSSCSTDGLLYGLVILLISYIIGIKIKKEKWLKLKSVLIILILAGCISTMKLPYVLVAGLVLIFNKDNYRYVQKNWLAFLCNVGLALLIACFSLFVYINVSSITCSRLGAPDSVEISSETVEKASESGDPQKSIIQDAHIQYVINNTGEWLKMLGREYKGVYHRARVSINGYFCLGNLYLLLLLSLLMGKRCANYLERIYMILIAIGIWFGILMVFYRMTDPWAATIPRIGDRYILPVIPLVAFALPQGNERTHKIVETVVPYALVVLMGANTISLLTVFW